MDTKALLISNSSSTKKGKRGVWHPFEEAQPYIQGIDTNIDKKGIDAQTLNALVSGIPSPWARARLFGFAFPYTQVEANIKKSGLVEFYEGIVNEWKGLVACLALFPERIRVSDPITLDFKNEQPLFDIPSALGRMLFEDADLWCDPDRLASDPDTKPFTQIIYYGNKQPIGATSPYSLVFTGVDYSKLEGASDMTWYRNGAFTDPLPFLNNDQKQKLYLLVRNIIDGHFIDFDNNVNRNRASKPRMDYTGLKEFLRQWKDDIRKSGNNIVDEGTLDGTFNFAQPYAPLFNVKQTLFFYPGGRVSFKAGSEAVEVDPQEILLQETHIIEFRQVDDKQPLAKSAVYYLQVINPDYVPNRGGQPEFLYFPVPLSEKGYLLFRSTIGDLLGGKSDKSHELRGHIKATDYKLVVELYLVIDDKKLTPIVKEYSLQPIENERSVMMWPNFISTKWTAYYLYSEFPQADKGTQLVPFFRNASTLEPILDDKGRLIYADSSNIDRDKLVLEPLVSYPRISLDSSFHKYDILRSNKPLAGLELRKYIDGVQKKVGYLILKKTEDDSMGDNMLRDYSNRSGLQSAVVGIDFGSNNSCMQVAREDGTEVRPVPFSNRRVFLVGAEVIDKEQARIALPHELYFFQNEAPINGQVKSWVHEHDPRYIVPGMESQAIAGGVSVFKPNIHIKAMDKRTITTNAGTLHHSMKWLTEKSDIDKKTAYLKNLWLKACADLYATGAEPKRLRWSYPGSFSGAEVTQYQKIFSEIVGTTPIQGSEVRVDHTGEASTEAEAVSNYALSTGISLGDTNLFLGIDVGGSTSDILLIVLDRASRSNRMVKQSSLRLAAGYLVDAIRRSRAFRSAIMRYYNQPGTPIKIPNIGKMEEEPSTAPFFLNSIFDRLRDEDFKGFYNTLSKYEGKVFAMPMYITGLLLYYSGQLVAKTIEDNEFLQRVRRVNLFPFGKGGRIFDWLGAHTDEHKANQYYNECFRTGFASILPGQEISQQITLEKENSVRKDNKSEVAKGLVSATSNRVTTDSDVRRYSDIFGEEGFQLMQDGKPVEIEADMPITSEHFHDMRFDLVFPERFKQFEQFLDIFLKYAGPREMGILSNTSSLKEKSLSISKFLQGYIEEDAEYKKARRESKENFDFKHSMLVLEGMCFLDKFLMEEVYRD
ncbi:MAG: hypothetical protein OHK0039_00280 [Bacteroidia bacterium]